MSLRHWVVTTWLYQIALSVAMGAIIGYLARKTLKIAYNRKLVDHESFLAYGVGLALFTLGVVGLIGSDDILACFVAGNSLTCVGPAQACLAQTDAQSVGGRTSSALRRRSTRTRFRMVRAAQFA